MELVSSVFSIIWFLGVAAFTCAVHFIFLTSLFKKDTEAWLLIVSVVITLAFFSIGLSDNIQVSKEVFMLINNSYINLERMGKVY